MLTFWYFVERWHSLNIDEIGWPLIDQTEQDAAPRSSTARALQLLEQISLLLSFHAFRNQVHPLKPLVMLTIAATIELSKPLFELTDEV
ncbi:hypothetical protein O9992_09855 [Vibrio lentus]|nr:hypothetical protein [Vibrio lentus]